MRLFEFVLLFLAVAGAWLLRPGATALVRWTFVVLTAVLVGTHLALEGAHWQMIPAYLALALALWFGLGEGTGRWTRSASVVLCLAAAAMSFVLPMFRLPRPTGADAVGTRTVHLQDGPRELVVQLWYPASADSKSLLARYTLPAEAKLLLRYESKIRTNSYQDAAVLGGRYPVVLLEHMWGGRRTGYTFLAEELASHGFVVAAVDHTGNSARTQLNGGRVVITSGPGVLQDVDAHSAAEVEAVWGKQLDLWTADNEFLLDQLAAWNADPAHPFGGHLAMDRVGAVGHSFGGAASMRLLGLDPRVKCAVNLDGWTFGGLDRRTTQPVLFVYQGVSRVRVNRPGTEGTLDADDDAAVDQTLAAHGGYRVYVDGTQHLDFSDQPLVSPVQRLTYTGPLTAARSQQITRGLVLGFLEQSLNGQGQGPARYPEVHQDGPVQPR